MEKRLLWYAIKLLSVKIGILLLVINGCATAPPKPEDFRLTEAEERIDWESYFGQDWILYRRDVPHSSFSYFHKSITYTPEGTCRVWTRLMLKWNPRKGEWRRIDTLEEIDCVNRRYRVLQNTGLGVRDTPKWVYIHPDSSPELLFEIICPK